MRKRSLALNGLMISGQNTLLASELTAELRTAMATADAEVNDEDDIRRNPVASGSDHVYDFYCELCRDDSKYVEAEAFCVDCDEYLCDLCSRSHTRTRLTRHHAVLDKEDMPKDAPLSPEKVSRDIATKCPCHNKRTVEFYCKTHDKLGCSLCFVRGHGNCGSAVECIADQLGVFESKEYEDFIKEMRSLEKAARGVVSKTQLHVTEAGRYKADAVEAMEQFRHLWDVGFDNFEDSLTRQSEQTELSDIANMTCLSAEGNRIAEEIEQTLSDLAHLQTSRLACQLYIRMKEAKGDMDRLKNSLRKAENQNVITRYRFDPNGILEGLINRPNGIGSLYVLKDISPKHLSDLGVLLRVGVGVGRGRYYHETLEDSKAWITSIAPLSSKVVVADAYYKRLTLIDIS